MKLNMILAACLTFSIAVGTLTSCSQGQKSNSETVDKTGPEYTSAYVCPMHCKGSGSDEPGTCSVCGMDLVKNEDHEMHQQTEEAAEEAVEGATGAVDSLGSGSEDGHEGHGH